MSILFGENFNYYGLDANGQGNILMGQGFWSAPGNTGISVPPWETTGKRWYAVGATSGGGIGRRNLGGAQVSLGGVTRVRFPQLPPVDNQASIVQQLDAGAAETFSIRVRPDGNIRCLNSAGVVQAETLVPCILPGVSHKVAWQMVYGSGTATVEVRVDNTAVIGGTSPIVGTGKTIAGTASLFSMADGAGSAAQDWWIDFVVVYNLTGTYNTNFPNISGCTYSQLTGVPVNTFTPRPRQKFGAGVMLQPGSNSLLDCSTSANFDLGNGAFTMETWYRPSAQEVTTDVHTLFGKWLETGSNNRSYRLVRYGPSVNNGALRWEISTDGASGTIAVINSVVFPFVIGHWYHIAVSRTASQTRLFIDGVQYGLTAADANTYFAAGTNSKFTVGGLMSNNTTGVLAGSSVAGRFDEFRATVGVGRYTANFTPPVAAFPRTIGGDPSFASVQLLFGFDNSVIDESTTAVKTLTARGTTAREVNADAASAYLVANQLDPDDTRYLEASFIKAANILQFSGQPANGEQVVLGATTYTFNTVLGAANSILIGATTADSMQNLIDAVNLGPGIGTRYGTGTVQNASASATLGPALASDINMQAIIAGAVGNAIVTTETVANAAYLSGATMAGGADIPAFSEYTMTPLPPTATGLRALILIDRSFIDADNATLRKSLNVSGFVVNGTDNALTTSPAYRADVIEQDPSTGAAVTPITVINGRIRLARTS